jgi:porphobilinogen synthase
MRENQAIRDLAAETRLLARDLIMPYFMVVGKNRKETIKAMPGIFRLSVDHLIKELEDLTASGVKAILLFGIPDKKDAIGSEAYKSQGVVQRAIKAIKKEYPDLVVISDVCLCGYTTHGHCGVVENAGSRRLNVAASKMRGNREVYSQVSDDHIDNHRTLNVLARVALSHAEAGVDLVAPSAMMDGQVAAIRNALDKKGFKEVGILAYSAKYASNFYGPFREALDSTPQFGDRKTYQMDYRNSNEALREIEEDIKEGADIVMVKPALAYLDIISRAKQKFNFPLAAYNVSGEYAMIKNSESEKAIALEVLTAIKRAGADFIITYFAKEAAKWL